MIKQHLRIYTRLDGLCLAFFMLCLVLLVYVTYGSCASYIESWLGYLPTVSHLIRRALIIDLLIW